MNNIQDLEEAIATARHKPIVILKHSTRCSISSVVLDRFERAWNESEVAPVQAYFLDLIGHRDISDRLESQFDIRHESPQILIIFKDQCVYHNSHLGVSYARIKAELDGLEALPSGG